jgi:sugar-specific transcriptional regulator TrmB
MELDFSVLREVGLTEAQIKVYVSLLELGQVTSGKIIKKSGLQNSVVYNALNQLIEKGLVSFISKGKRKYFSALSLNNLISFIDERKQKVEELIKQLPKSSEKEENVESFIGWRGVYSAFNRILEELSPESEYLAFAGDTDLEYPKEAINLFKEFQKKRNYQKYKVKIIANEIARKNIQKYRYYIAFGKPNYRYVPGLSPAEIIIFNDCVLTLSVHEKPMAVLIRSKNIAESYKNFFYTLWKIAKP